MSVKSIKIGYTARYYLGRKKSEMYEVISVRNTTEHVPGEELDKSEVDRMCGSSTWDVTLVPLNKREV